MVTRAPAPQLNLPGSTHNGARCRNQTARDDQQLLALTNALLFPLDDLPPLSPTDSGTTLLEPDMEAQPSLGFPGGTRWHNVATAAR